MSDIKKEVDRWESSTLKKALDKFPERKEQFTTTSHI